MFMIKIPLLSWIVYLTLNKILEFAEILILTNKSSPLSLIFAHKHQISPLEWEIEKKARPSSDRQKWQANVFLDAIFPKNFWKLNLYYPFLIFPTSSRCSENTKKTSSLLNWFHLPGNVLLSQGREPQLPSAQKSLTSVFGMGTGVASSPSLPDL